jgi:hypothetical protein
MIMAEASSASSEELHQEADDHLRWLLDESGEFPDLLAGFWETCPNEVAEESLLTAQLMQALLQAEHRQDRQHRNETDTVDGTVTHEFISSLVNRIAARLIISNSSLFATVRAKPTRQIPSRRAISTTRTRSPRWGRRTPGVWRNVWPSCRSTSS